VANLISARSSKVFLLPEWSAWMADEHFYLTRYPPEKKKACAFVSCCGFCHHHLRSTGQARYLRTFTKRETRERAGGGLGNRGDNRKTADTSPQVL
jgi:hypothetical protein